MTIKEWLNSDRDFEVGRQLYDKYGSLPNLKNRFAIKGCKLMDKLIYELQKIEGVDEHALPKINNAGSRSAMAVTLNKASKEQSEFATAPESVKAIIIDSSNIRKQMSRLHESLFYLTDEEDRHKAALELLNLQKRFNENGVLLQEYKRLGKLPEELQAEKEEMPFSSAINALTDPLKIQRLILNHRTYKSRADSEEKAKEHEERIKLLEAKLKTIQNG